MPGSWGGRIPLSFLPAPPGRRTTRACLTTTSRRAGWMSAGCTWCTSGRPAPGTASSPRKPSSPAGPRGGTSSSPTRRGRAARSGTVAASALPVPWLEAPPGLVGVWVAAGGPPPRTSTLGTGLDPLSPPQLQAPSCLGHKGTSPAPPDGCLLWDSAFGDVRRGNSAPSSHCLGPGWSPSAVGPGVTCGAQGMGPGCPPPGCPQTAPGAELRVPPAPQPRATCPGSSELPCHKCPWTETKANSIKAFLIPRAPRCGRGGDRSRRCAGGGRVGMGAGGDKGGSWGLPAPRALPGYKYNRDLMLGVRAGPNTEQGTGRGYLGCGGGSAMGQEPALMWLCARREGASRGHSVQGADERLLGRTGW